MRIVHYSTSLSRSAGGLYYSVSGLARALSALGASVTVIGGADRHFETDRAIWNGVPLITFPLSGGAYGWNRKVHRTLERLAPQLFHLHGIWSAGAMQGRFVSTKGVRRVVSPRGMLDPWILKRKPWVKRAHAGLFERPLMQRAHVHALNETERQSVMAFMPSLKDRTFVVPNGIDQTVFEPAAGPRSGTLYLGRLRQKKQTLELIRAWSRRPRDQHLVIAGWGEPDYERQVQQVADATANVSFVGALYGAEKMAAFASSRFFVLPSLSEGLPMAVLEALQHGCVPIITDACNMPDLFAEDIALRMNADFSDFGALMDRVVAMNANELARRPEKARAYAERYRWDRVASDMLSFYEAILSGRSVT